VHKLSFLLFFCPISTKTDYGIYSGKQLDGGDCDFEFNSHANKSGEVYSPNFPGFYPKEMDCTYRFIGAEKGLRFYFTEISLLGTTE